ncbi:MAG: helix-turn-helix domain-containing protein, partial [Anaerolineae bacterium]|nr:helix-turn-helix domain-containing protein [Anaerolineae bacterium]
FGSTLVTCTPEILVTWSIMVRAQPPAFPHISGGELALISMDVLRGFDTRITLAEVVEALATAGVHAVAVDDDIPHSATTVANQHEIALIALPKEANLARIERAINTLIVNQKAQMQERALEVQRQLVRLAADNRDLNSLLQVMARAAAKPIIVHDDAGVTMAQVYPNTVRRVVATPGNRPTPQNLPYGEFQNWLMKESPSNEGVIVRSPLGFTTVLKVEKRVAGYLSLVDGSEWLEEFDRLVLTHGAEVCAIELAKNRAIAFAVEQTRGDWVQVWLSRTPADDDLMRARAQQAGFDLSQSYFAVVFRASTAAGVSLPLEGLVGLVRDDMTRRQIAGAVGHYVDSIVALYAVNERLKTAVEEVREQLASRTPGGLVASGISRPATGLAALREAYREAKNALSIAFELGEREQTTFFGELKLFQFLLALKEHNLESLRRFHDETLGALFEHDERKQGELIRTLNGFFEANGNLAKASDDLKVHRNTLVYRLDRIKDLTGLDLNDA